MSFRKLIFISCIILLTVLFINGFLSLLYFHQEGSQKLLDKTNPFQIKRIQETKQGVESPFNILVFGLDEEEVRSDVILLLNFSPKDIKLNVLSVSRDTKVTARGKTVKVNSLIGIGGEKLAVEGVEELTGLPVKYYITLNFKGFRKMIDTMDGVEMDVPMDMDYDDPDQNLHIHLKKGKQVLNGDEAEQLVRYRKGNRTGEGYEDGDLGRIKMQQEFIKAFIEQKLKLKYFSKLNDIFFILKQYLKTNIEIGDLNKNLLCLKSLHYNDVKSFTIPGEAAYIRGLWYFIYDEYKTKELIDNNFFKG